MLRATSIHFITILALVSMIITTIFISGCVPTGSSGNPTPTPTSITHETPEPTIALTPTPSPKPVPVVDQDCTSGTPVLSAALNGSLEAFQVFTPSTANLPQVDVYLLKSTAPAPDADLIIKIVNLDQTTNLPTSSLFKTSLQSSIPISIGKVSIFPNLTTLTPGNKYGIILKTNCTSGYYQTNYFSGNNPYPGGCLYNSVDRGVNWSIYSNDDLMFTTYK